MFEKDN